MKIVLPAIYRAGRYTIRTSDYPPRVPETTVCLKRLFMRSIKGSLAGLILTGILAIVPAAAFAHGAEPVVTDLGEEVEVTLLSEVVMHLADSQGMASVRDPGGCES